MSVQSIVAAIMAAALGAHSGHAASVSAPMPVREQAALIVGLGREGLAPSGLTESPTLLSSELQKIDRHASWSQVWAQATGAPVLTMGAQGPAVAALETWLSTFGLYAGAIDGQFGPLVNQGVTAFQSAAGLSPDGSVNRSTLIALRRAIAWRLAATQHLSYRLGSPASLSLLALATGYPESALTAANHWSTASLAAGTTVRWPSSKPASTLQAGLPVSVPGSTQGIVALVVVGGSPQELGQLQAKSHRLPFTAALFGEQVLTDPPAALALMHGGEEIELAGYSGVALNQLPQAAVNQEVSWGDGALAAVLHTPPRYLVTAGRLTSSVSSGATASGLTAVAPSVVLTGSPSALVQKTTADLKNGAILVYPDTAALVAAWPGILTALRQKAFWPVTLAQLKAAQP